MEPLLATGICALLVLCVEGTLWFLFTRKIRGLVFPPETDESVFRFHGTGRAAIFAILHSIFLLTVIAILLFFLW